ncbi:MAG: hypothetical protein GXP55_23500 [Deltaproteobacteria bacterium]|nr:hypothetical protein [Deltaproteobacteria bacterium]
MTSRFALGLLGLLLFAACGMQGRQSLPARLRVIAVPVTARVYVDDHFAGSARVFDAHPRELRPGAHQITLRAPGYFPHDLELELPSGTTTVRVRLRAIPP